MHGAHHTSYYYRSSVRSPRWRLDRMFTSIIYRVHRQGNQHWPSQHQLHRRRDPPRPADTTVTPNSATVTVTVTAAMRNRLLHNHLHRLLRIERHTSRSSPLPM